MAPVPRLPEALHTFGIRHHGPGCARSLLHALEALRPEVLLIEGPPDAQALLDNPALLLADTMRPPVALLSHCPDEPQRARYHPFAEFSPEWQALRWAARAGVPVRFIDLPMAHVLALEKAREATDPAGPDGGEASPQAAQGSHEAHPAAATPDVTPDTTPDAIPQAAAAPLGEAAAPGGAAGGPSPQPDPAGWRDPLDWLARAAGYADGEAWWNHMVEERGDGSELFAAIDEAMCTLRAELPPPPLPEHEAQLEALREAHMRQSVRAALKDGAARVAVVVGAWHLGGLKDGLLAKAGAPGSAKADAALLKGLPKLKTTCTWVPWTNRHLSRASGYGAGIEAPGWYEHLWQCSARAAADAAHQRSVGWMARVARLMRERGLDCSSAHLIEAARLADTLAAMRQRPAAGLEELNEACRSVLTLGDESVLHFLRDALLVGDRLGQVPPEVPAVPLQRDLERQQKTLRLKPEATHRSLDLDLRQPTDLARSQLLHRLTLLELPWGQRSRWGAGGSRGTFHEVWGLQWQPEFALKLIEASVWGETVASAASARARREAAQETQLPALSALIDQALLADLPDAVHALAEALAQRAALSSDTPQLLEALPALARTYRYGNVRQTDAALVATVLDQLAQRAALALPLATTSLDDTSAAQLREAVLGAHNAITLRDQAALTADWQTALARVADRSDTHPLLQGLATRLLLDTQARERDSVADAMALHLSAGSDPARAAAWLEGFLNGNATVLLHDARVWALMDGWLCSLGDEHFLRVLPLVRRSFSRFEAADLRDLGERVRQGRRPAGAADGAAAALDWDLPNALLPLPFLATVLGLGTLDGPSGEGAAPSLTPATPEASA